ncbi:MAG: hypothetical protein ABJN95_09405 [Maribacter sp.]|uniref:hypothetical protein n=1 Tax=Maribacter sp. TaxID=1897614 RepID=UPI003296BF2D
MVVRFRRFLILGTFAALLSCDQTEKESKSFQDFPFTEDHWRVENEDETTGEIDTLLYKGKLALKLGPNQKAYLKNKNYKNFVLEFYCNGLSAPGFGFRLKDKQNFEYLYLRLGLSEKKDALQYLPIYNGSLPWQLYNYPKYEGQAEFPREEVATLPQGLRQELVDGKASDTLRSFLKNKRFSFSEAAEVITGDDVNYIFDPEEMKVLLFVEVNNKITFLDSRTWIHVKVEVKGDMAVFYIEDMERSAFVVEHLKRDPIAGGISLVSDAFGVYFSNVSIAELKETKEEVYQEKPSTNYVTEWKVSKMFAKDSLKFAFQLDSVIQNKNKFKTIHTDEDGLLNISRFYDDMTKTIVLSCNLESDVNREVKLEFDYADHLVLFLNSEIVFDKGMNFKPPADKGMEGRVFVNDESVMLDLKQGANRLDFMLSADNRQKFNWGIIARLADTDGLKFN